ncbi:hypothetical protein [Roseibium salinum]|uniref:Uncharacterized protein n=1 Tax=Roseibium salinum TaxID=1604349 RepID=A0ABT3R1Z6_9HYPH|nr:hypothetical protein [Roseibium sp. DSM 29163]MCX2723175.1 hypothetical protein [Roseibium sp. DSM 29163]
MAINMDHLMAESSSFGKACREARCGTSGKWRNAADGLLSATRRAGLFCPLTSLDRACGGIAPQRAIRLGSRQKRSGQMNHIYRHSL